MKGLKICMYLLFMCGTAAGSEIITAFWGVRSEMENSNPYNLIILFLVCAVNIGVCMYLSKYTGGFNLKSQEGEKDNQFYTEQINPSMTIKPIY
tara:strand:+ start:147 stop:428 length:282 start_codon:yes stop_codon:yes gene_type:complete